MTTERFTQQKLDVFGGLVTLLDKSDLQYGQAAEATNCEFVPGALRTRRGIKALTTVPTATGLAPGHILGASVNVSGTPTGRVESYAMSATDPVKFVTWLSARWNTIVGDTITPGSGSTGKVYGVDNGYQIGVSFFPLKYEFNQYSRYLYAARRWQNLGMSSPIRGYTRRHGCGSPSTGATLANSASAGSVAAGVHWCLVVFETESGYRSSGVGKPTSLTATGAKKIDVTAIPIGPPGTIKRLLFFTAADVPLGTGAFPYSGYYCIETTASGMVINDNTSTTSAVDFTDLTLLAGTPIDPLLTLAPCSPTAAFTQYRDRQVAISARPTLNPPGIVAADTPNAAYFNLFNLQMESDVAGLPVGWEVTSLGGTLVRDTADFPSTYWKMAGAGTGLASGGLQCNGAATSGVPAAVPAKTYYIQFLAKKIGTGVGTVYITPPGSISPTHSYVTQANGWGVYTAGPFVGGRILITGGVVPPFAVSCIADAGTDVCVADVQFLDGDISQREIHVSRAFETEAYDMATGLIAVDDQDGQEVTAAFELRGNLYICKERSLYVTQDNGDEPNTWSVQKVSDEAGAFGPSAVGVGDNFAILINTNGAFLFDGGIPQKISDEIRPTWITATASSTSNAQGAYNWCAVSIQHRKVWIGVAMTDAVPERMFTIDYADGWGLTERKWSEWTVSAAQGKQYAQTGNIVPQTGDLVLAYSNTALTDSVLESWPGTDYKDTCSLIATGYANVAQVYETAPFPSNSVGQSLWGYMTSNVSGVGNLRLSLVGQDGTVSALAAKAITATQKHDLEYYLNKIAERYTIKAQNGSVAGDYLKMQRITAFLRQAPYQWVRGNG